MHTVFRQSLALCNSNPDERGFVVVRTDVKINPFRDYKALLLSNADDRQSLELLMKQLDSGE